MTKPRRAFRSAIGLLAVAGAATVWAQAPAVPAAASQGRAKELVVLMKENKLESFAARDDMQPGRFVAALLINDVQLLAVSAAYSRPSDVEYALYTKDFMTAYMNLKSGALSSDRFFVEDAQHDGLVAAPGKNPQHDAVTTGTTKLTFDGVPMDPKKKKQAKMTPEDYVKAFADADLRYVRLLDVLISGLKKPPVLLDASGPMR